MPLLLYTRVSYFMCIRYCLPHTTCVVDLMLACYNHRVIVKMLPSYSAGANVMFVVDDLSSDTEYVFACYASSVVGDGVKSNQIRVRTSE